MLISEFLVLNSVPNSELLMASVLSSKLGSVSNPVPSSVRLALCFGLALLGLVPNWSRIRCRVLTC